jgi:syntaxin 1B/2/3
MSEEFKTIDLNSPKSSIEMTPSALSDAMARVDKQFKTKADIIAKNRSLIRQKSEQAIHISDGNKLTELSNEVSNIISESMKLFVDLKSLVNSVDGNKDLSPLGNKNVIKNHLATKVMTERELFETEVTVFKNIVNNISRRHLKLLNVDEQKIEKLIDDGIDIQQVQQMMLLPSDELKNVIEDIELRHHDIIGLERSVKELHEAFMDLATLIDVQDESISQIAIHIDNAKTYTDKGRKHLIVAQKEQKKSRSKMCCLLFIFLIVVMVIIFPILKANNDF